MKLQILHVPGCPNTAVLTARLSQALAGSGQAEVELREIRDHREAAAWRMTGSPTLLIDGADPFAITGRPPSLSCRLYVDETGTVSWAPSVTQLRGALSREASQPPRARAPEADARPRGPRRPVAGRDRERAGPSEVQGFFPTPAKPIRNSPG